MDRGTKVFWLIIVALFCASAIFGTLAEDRRRAAQTRGGDLATGDMVQLHRATDGDTLVVRTTDGEQLVVRLLGIKSFEPAPDKDPVAAIGREAIAALEKRVAGRPLRVLLHSTPKDRHGRTIATLIAGEEDIGLYLVSQGLALVYPVYPFQTLPMYLEVQSKARAEAKGLWANADTTRRAESLLTEWGKRAAE